MKFILAFFIFAGIAFGIIGLIGVGVYLLIKATQLSTYLKSSNYDRWRFITTITSPFGEIGPGMNNPFRFIGYINMKDDNDDEKTLKLKNSIKIGIRYFVLFIIATIFSFIIVFVLTYLQQIGLIEMSGVTVK